MVRCQASLSYEDMNMARDGFVMNRGQIRDERVRLGYCVDCLREPILLYRIRRNRLNPLWTSREPITIEGESLDGKCLRCHPELDPNRQRRRPRSAAGSSTSTRTTGSRRSAIGDDLLSQSQHPALANLRPSTRTNSPLNMTMSSSSPQLVQVTGVSSSAARTMSNPNPMTTFTDTGGLSSRASPIVRSHVSPTLPRRYPLETSSPLLPPSGEATVPSPWQIARNAVASNSTSDMTSVSSREVSVVSYDVTRRDSEESSSASVVSSHLSNGSGGPGCRRPQQDRHNECTAMVPSSLSSKTKAVRGTPDTNASSDDDDDDEEDDNLEVMFSRCRRMSSFRIVRTSSIRNLAADASGADASMMTMPSLGNNNHHQHHHNNNPALTRFIHATSGFGTNDATIENQQLPSRNLMHPTDPLNDRLSRNCLSISTDHLLDNPSDALPPTTHQESMSPLTPTSGEHVVAELKSLVVELSSEGNVDFTIDVLLGAMKDHQYFPQVQLYCMHMIWDLAQRSNQHKTSVMNTSAPDDILLCMKQNMNNSEIQEQACQLLTTLSFDKHNRAIIVRAGAPARLIKCLVDHRDNQSLVEAAIHCLRTLSPDSEFRQSVGVVEGVMHVCHAMKVHRSVVRIQRDGCSFLSNSAVDLDNYQVAQATDAEYEVIFLAMTTHKTEPSVMAKACFSLKNYTYDENNVRKLCQANIIVEILQRIACNGEHPNCRADAVNILKRVETCKLEDDAMADQIVASLQESIAGELDTSKACEAILAVMNEGHPSTKITMAVLQCLVTLSIEKPFHRAMISNDVLNSVMFKLINMVDSAPVIIYGCDFLSRVARDDNMKCRTAIIQAGACKAIVRASRRHLHNVAVQRAATCLLRLLSEEFECWFEMQQSDGNPLREILEAHPDEPILQQNGSEIITNLMAHDT